MRLFVPERDIVIGEEVVSFLRLLRSALGVGFMVLACPGKGEVVVDAEGRVGGDDTAMPAHLFEVAAALRQRLAIDDLQECAAYSDTRLPGVDEPLRFFASVPLIAPSGAGLGALCAVDTQPHDIGMAELAARMEDAARVAASLLAPRLDGATLAQLGFDLAQAERASRAHVAGEQRYRKMYERAAALAKIGVWECDLVTGRLTWTDGVYDIFGLPRGSRITREIVLPLYDHASRRELERRREQAIETGTGFTLDVRIRDVRGTLKWMRVTAEVEMENGTPVRIFGLKQDITADHRQMERLRQYAEHDALTGLANRAMFEQALAAQSAADPAGGPVCALLLVDLDGFKAVNDTYGHAVGDACLVEVAARLRRIFRGAEVIARIGGDEFAVLVRGGHAVSRLEGRARAAVEEIAKPICALGQVFSVGASVGIARAGGGEGGSASVTDLFARADSAMYAVKGAAHQRGADDAKAHPRPRRA
ncbi:diguanylate cyclase domain-containing protein [Xanthobacter variabilis]|uniref:diguanylate cyclase domain-containing protein n=1 Tax=Xanthobacter variabilis TaxID=3119932 RepID=UPI00374FC1F2